MTGALDRAPGAVWSVSESSLIWLEGADGARHYLVSVTTVGRAEENDRHRASPQDSRVTQPQSFADQQGEVVAQRLAGAPPAGLGSIVPRVGSWQLPDRPIDYSDSVGANALVEPHPVRQLTGIPSIEWLDLAPFLASPCYVTYLSSASARCAQNRR